MVQESITSKTLTLSFHVTSYNVMTGLPLRKIIACFDTINLTGKDLCGNLSSYARQFLGQMEKPDVDSIEDFLLLIQLIRKPPQKITFHCRYSYGNI
jgi:excinuclease ABC subunit A